MRVALLGVRDPQSGDAFSIVRCLQCQLGMTLPEPEDLEPYYGERYYGGRHWITRRYCAWRRMRVINQTTRGTAPSTLVDIGCGDGSFLLEARQAGWTVLGTEVNAGSRRPAWRSGAPSTTSGPERRSAASRCGTAWSI